MSVPTGAGNYPPGVTDNDPWFADESCGHSVVRGGYCEHCGELMDEDAAAEAAWDRMMEDGETFRGSEAAAYNAEQQAKIQRELKR